MCMSLCHYHTRHPSEEEARRAKTLESLPWESECDSDTHTHDESKSIITQALMEDILQLALCEKNFTDPPPAQIVECCNFDLQLYIAQAMRLLSLDQNLAHIHAKISPKMNEEIFWKHYFVRIYYLRCASGLLDRQDPIVQAVSSFPLEDVIHKATAAASVSSTKMPPSPDKGKAPIAGTGVKSATTMPVASSKAKTWENSSSEDVSCSEMSTSSYEVVGTTSGQVASPISNVAGNKESEDDDDDGDDDALFEAQVRMNHLLSHHITPVLISYQHYFYS
jgi:hypothetical protein